VAGGFAHASIAWPELSRILWQEIDADSETITTIFIGWNFGSMAMLAIGVIVILSFVQLRRGFAGARWHAFTVGVFYILFGLAAFWLRNLDPHFLFFISSGLLLCFSSILWKSSDLRCALTVLRLIDSRSNIL